MVVRLEDILNDAHKVDDLRIFVNTQYEVMKKNALAARSILEERSKAPGQSKNLNEFYQLVVQAVENFETRAGVVTANRIIVTEEEPDINASTPTITFSVLSREPGAHGQGAPGEANVKNLKPRLREEIDDPNCQGYRLAIFGYWHDNVVRFTCWARTGKTANEKAMWFERLMHEYDWWFRIQGISRVFFMKRGADITLDINGIRWYGRPLDYFVRTEDIEAFSEKKLEEVVIDLMVKNI